jgi:hypothetical protein
MGLFRRRHRESATPVEDAAEGEVASPHQVFQGTPNLTGSGSSSILGEAAILGVAPQSDPISRERNRADADLEDDGAETQLINEERHREEY